MTCSALILAVSLLAGNVDPQQSLMHRRQHASSATQCTDYTPSATCAWHLNEASGTRFGDLGAIGGADCDLSDINTVLSGTGLIGDAADFETDDVDYLTCDWDTTGGCDEIETAAESNAYSMCGWFNLESRVGQSRSGLGVSDFTSVYTQIMTEFGTPNWEAEAIFSPVTTDSDVAISASTWVHQCTAWANDADDEVNIYLDGELQVGTVGIKTAATTFAENEADPKIGWDASNKHLDGLQDEVSVWPLELTAGEACYLCSCNWDGSQCTGTGASYTDSGFNVARCGSCSLPGCHDAAP